MNPPTPRLERCANCGGVAKLDLQNCRVTGAWMRVKCESCGMRTGEVSYEYSEQVNANTAAREVAGVWNRRA